MVYEKRIDVVLCDVLPQLVKLTLREEMRAVDALDPHQ
jgi:hypothetical protein